MKETLETVIAGIMEIREMVEMGELDETSYELPTFRYEPETISQVLKELKECI